MAPADDLNAVDAQLRWLDLPFDLNQWTKLYITHGSHTLSAYLGLLADAHYQGLDWSKENERWRAAREQDILAQEMEVLDAAHMRDLHSRWSTEYTVDELKFLEDYYNRILATQNVSTPILQEYARDLCEIELLIKKGVRNGEDVKKYMDARDNIIKMGNFTASNSKNAADFDSVGELITYYVKRGWLPEYSTEPQDSIDFLMKDNHTYLKRLVEGEGNFAEQVADKRATYNLAERFDHDDISGAERNTTPMQFEDEDEFGGDLNG